MRTGLTADLDGLERYPYGSHSALMGKMERPWQAVDEILARFGAKRGLAREKCREFVAAGSAQGHRPDLTGGGLVRSAGGWSEVLSLRRRKERMAADERVLGGGGFVESVLEEAEEREKGRLRLSTKRVNLETLEFKVAQRAGLAKGEIRTAGRRRIVVRARHAFSQIAVRRLGYSGAEVARYLGVTTSCVNRAAGSAPMEALATEVVELGLL